MFSAVMVSLVESIVMVSIVEDLTVVCLMEDLVMVPRMEESFAAIVVVVAAICQFSDLFIFPDI